VLDNASTDKTSQIIHEKYKGKIHHFFQSENNKFLTGGNNYLMKFTSENLNPKYILVLNPDTKLEKNLISTLVTDLENDERLGAAGPKTVFFKNENEGKINSAGLFYDGFMQAYDIGFMEKDEGQFDKKDEVFGVSGSCILYRVSMIKEIGVYDDSIKMYLDEIEMFIRAKKKGWKVLYDGSVTLHHSYMQSTDANKVFNAEKQKKKAWLHIALKHYPLKSKLAMLKKYYLDK